MSLKSSSTTFLHLVSIAVSWTRLNLALLDWEQCGPQWSLKNQRSAKRNELRTWIVLQEGFVRKHNHSTSLRIQDWLWEAPSHFAQSENIMTGELRWDHDVVGPAQGCNHIPRTEKTDMNKELKIETTLFKSTAILIIRSSQPPACSHHMPHVIKLL